MSKEKSFSHIPVVLIHPYVPSGSRTKKNLDVVCVCGNVGQEETGLDAKKRRRSTWAFSIARVLDLRDEFSDEFLTKSHRRKLHGENKYPLLSALSRPLLAKKLVEVAHEFGATYVAHGCTGKGNDQVRFEAAVKALDPELKVIAPVREWDLKCRPDEVAYAHAHNVPVPEGANDNPYSIDDNLWGRAIECGHLEDPWNEPLDDAWVMTKNPEDTPDTLTYTEIEFEAGKPVAVDGKKMKLSEIVIALNKISGDNGFGRLDLVEDRLVGLKSRECYEGSRRPDAHHRPQGARGHLRRGATCSDQDQARAGLGHRRVQRPVVQPAQERARRLYGRYPEVRDRHCPSEVL